MALFKTKKTAVGKTEAKPVSAGASGPVDLSWVLKAPRITERATDVMRVRAYVFNVSRKANKRQIAQAVQLVYKVTPVKVRTVPLRSKVRKNARTGIVGHTAVGKKAYVYLKEGDTITLA
ncbi:MAG: 50S ribosomal protein L23 [Patescibacteria group bacterium]